MRPAIFPAIIEAGLPRSADFIIYASQVKQLFKQLIPTSDDVLLLSGAALQKHDLGCRGEKKRQLVRQVCEHRLPGKAGSSSLLFPLGQDGDDTLVALVSGIDPVVVARASDEWLNESRASFEHEFARIRSNGTDPLSSLYNTLLFSHTLATIECESDFHLVLVELLPRARSPREVFAHVLAMSRALQGYNRFSFPLFHIGQSVFAFIIPDRDRQFLKGFCLSLISYLKTKQARRVHCGSSSLTIERPEKLHSGADRQVIVDEAWHALHEACRRGPFAFCDYDILSNPENFPLQPPSRSILARLQRRWKDLDSYAVIFFKPDFEARERLDSVVLALFDDESVVVDINGYLVLKPGLTEEKARRWAGAGIERLKKEHGDRYSLSAGISSYPFRNYSRPQIVRNCQKALLHGAFFGPGSCVIFDALSLNISGDIFFGEGDLPNAVQEYRKGLELASGFDSNLLNSLGVTYALMNRTVEALDAFNKVLDQLPENFMALYNKGLIEQSTGNYEPASHCFSRALLVYDPDDDEESGAISDLNFQLGVAWFHCKKFKECCTQLETWYERQKDRRAAGKCCRFIGIGYYYLDMVAEASKWLQRGLAFDEFDAESLSLLGGLYLKEQEGDEIALRLAEKSVEINSGEPLFLLRYARALAACGDLEMAITYLKKCVGTKKTRYRAWFELLQIYYQMRDEKMARLYAKKLTTNKAVPAELQELARRIKAG